MRKVSKDQGHLIVVNRGRTQRTKSGDGMEYTDGSCCGDKVGYGVLLARASGGRIRERGGDSCGREGVRATVSPKEEKGGRGVQYGDESEDREPIGCREKGEAHSTRGRRVLHDLAATREQGANGPNTDNVRRARSEITQHA